MKRTLEKREESANHGVCIVMWPSAIWYSKSAEWHSSFAKWHAAPQSYTHAIPWNFTFSCKFLRMFDTQKDCF